MLKVERAVGDDTLSGNLWTSSLDRVIIARWMIWRTLQTSRFCRSVLLMFRQHTNPHCRLIVSLFIFKRKLTHAQKVSISFKCCFLKTVLQWCLGQLEMIFKPTSKYSAFWKLVYFYNREVIQSYATDVGQNKEYFLRYLYNTKALWDDLVSALSRNCAAGLKILVDDGKWARSM